MGINRGGRRGKNKSQEQQQPPLYSLSSEEYLTSRMSGWDEDDEEQELYDDEHNFDQSYDLEGCHQRLDEDVPVSSTASMQSRILMVNERWSARISSITKDDEDEEEEFSDEDSLSFDDNQDGFQINDMMMGVLATTGNITSEKSSTFLSSTSMEGAEVDVAALKLD